MAEGVVVLHGIFRTHRSMKRLAAHLEREGYSVLNLDYPSTRLALDELAEHIRPAVASFEETLGGAPLHMVGYSMGGLLIRAYLAKYRPANPGRIVMLATPNAGSEVADYFRNWWPYRRYYGPAGGQLGTKGDYLKNLPVPQGCDIGIVAGNRTLDPLCGHIIGRPSDGKVSVESTKLPGAAHVVIRGTHTFFPENRAAWRHAAHFLRHGRFEVQTGT